MNRGNAVDLDGISVCFGSVVAVDAVTFSVGTGEVFGFLGPNGAGKSTTIRTMLDLQRPWAGRSALFGEDVRSAGARLRRRVGYLPGDLALFPFFTGEQTLDFFASLHGGRKTERDLLIDRLDLSRAALRRRVAGYSTGMRQKIGIVCALQHRPELLILDEPTSGLDPDGRDAFLEIVKECRNEGRTVLFSSHLLDEVERCADRVGIIAGGTMRLVDSLDRVLGALPRHVRVLFRDGSEKTFLHKGEWSEFLGAFPPGEVRDLEIRRPRLDEVYRSVAEGRGGGP